MEENKLKEWIDWGIVRIQAAAANGGIWLALIIAAFIAGLIVALIYIRPINEIPATREINIVPASGEQGFDVETFCKDPLTKVGVPFINPDASGITFTLQRIRDGRTETVTLVRASDGTWPYAKHFWEDDRQNSNSAFVSPEALECINRKQGQ